MQAQLMLWWENFSSLEYWMEALERFQCLGPLVPILLALLESLIPALPLVAIVTLNVAAHGPLWGFFYSWLGASVGSVLVFEFFRRIVKRMLHDRIADSRHEVLRKAHAWVNEFDAGALFLIAILPFTPSSFLNIAFGISDFDEVKYIRTILCSKSIMIALLAVFGQSFVAAFENPWIFCLSLAIIAALYWGSKKIREKYRL